MEDKKEGMNTCGTCSTGKCGVCMAGGCEGGSYKKHFLKKILVIVVILLAFALGMQLGELKGEIRGGRGGYGMMKFYGDGFPARNMMYGGGTVNVPATAPVTPTAPVR